MEHITVEHQWLVPYGVVGVFVLVAAAVGLGPFSGYGTPPMFGDFEAQRHWLEITTHLSPKQWYFYDLQWWGLDYPPLTAFHSYVLGRLGSLVDSSWFALDASRGSESDDLKAYMRFTVLASQLLLYVPFVWQYASQRAVALQTPYLEWHLTLAQFLLLPSLIIIDNGHFQYNCVMLGLFVGSVAALQRERIVLASALFVSSLFFKQMALYWSPVIFFYILGKCHGPYGFGLLVKVAFTVVLLSALHLVPWITSLQQLQQVLVRVFPFGRGLWEDKVANFWCATNTVLKWKVRYEEQTLAKMALGATLVAIAPSCAAAFLCRSRVKLTLAFSCCAWAFYLFSFQVHEKSVLVPLLPTSLLLFEHNDEWTAMVQWLNNAAYFSMFPLLWREKLGLQYFVLAALANLRPQFPHHWFNRVAVGGSYAAMAGAAIAQYGELLPFAVHYPDLYVLLNASVSFGCFAYGFLWLHRQLYTLNS